MTRPKNGNEQAGFHLHDQEIGWAGLLQLIERQAARAASNDNPQPVVDLVAEFRDLLQAWGVFQTDRPVDGDQSDTLSPDEGDGSVVVPTPSSDPGSDAPSAAQADVGDGRTQIWGQFEMPAPLTNDSDISLDSPLPFDPASLTETELDGLLAQMQGTLPEPLDKVREAVTQAFPDHAFFPGGAPGEALASLLPEAEGALVTPAPLAPPTDFIG